MSLNPFKILNHYYDPNSLAYRLLVEHSVLVTKKALDIAGRLEEKVDKQFIYEAAMLHDIGICKVNAPKMGCTGSHTYIEHGYLGRELLEAEWLPKHALVCERHTGVGLSKEYITSSGLPLPARDMLAVSLEEKIISYADLFYGKIPGKTFKGKIFKESTVQAIREKLGRYSDEFVERFNEWHEQFGDGR